MPGNTLLSLLRQGASAWNEWRAAHAEARADLSNMALYGLDLVGVNLAGANLHKADLRGTVLTGATLAGADLSSANFFRAVLVDADLSGANLVGAQFLSCTQLVTAKNWQSAIRDRELACGAPIPRMPDEQEQVAAAGTRPGL
jgi:uncharacterized protein YjbI with pentapeptide repeats